MPRSDVRAIASIEHQQYPLDSGTRKMGECGADDVGPTHHRRRAWPRITWRVCRTGASTRRTRYRPKCVRSTPESMMSLLRRRRLVVLSAGGSGVHVWAASAKSPLHRQGLLEACVGPRLLPMRLPRPLQRCNHIHDASRHLLRPYGALPARVDTFHPAGTVNTDPHSQRRPRPPLTESATITTSLRQPADVGPSPTSRVGNERRLGAGPLVGDA